MSIRARQEYTREVSARYQRATRPEKSSILDDFCQTGGYSRKYAIGLLVDPPPQRTRPIQRPRAQVYGPDVRRALGQLWKVSDGLCSKRLIPFLPELIAALERHNELCLPEPTRGKVLALSPATADRLLRSVRSQHLLGGLSTTDPATLLRRQIPVRTDFPWDQQVPGYLEVDLVAHCAESTAGDFLYTLTLTDIATGWTECQALLNRCQIGVTQAIERVRNLLPFPILGIDSDNGAEFINHLLKRYCDRNHILFTRCRPYHKNDQCHVEQKNGCVVRQHIGYARYQGEEERRLLQHAYRWLRRHVNFFQPSVKLLAKHRDQAGIHKHYDRAQTPYQRLLAFDVLHEQTPEDLQTFYLDLNPVEILHELRAGIRALQQAQTRRTRAAQSQPSA